MLLSYPQTRVLARLTVDAAILPLYTRSILEKDPSSSPMLLSSLWSRILNHVAVDIATADLGALSTVEKDRYSLSIALSFSIDL